MGKKDFSPFKMKFSIQEEEKKNKSFSHSKKHRNKLDSLPRRFCEFSNQGISSMKDESTKKCFRFRRRESPFIQIDGEDFSSAEEIQERFGLSRTVFFNQLCKKKTHFLDSGEISHEVTWASPRLEKFLNLMRVKAADEKFLHARARKRMSQAATNINAGMNKCVENCQATF